jgi:Arc/MetJ-type ribon-helix-helix transcriptional regulator
VSKTAELKVRLEPTLLEEVMNLAAEMHKTKSEVVREGILALRQQREKRAALDALKQMAAEDKPLRKGARGKARFRLE